jgi:DNA (cytosine-5)-methyltransferase 1
MRELALFAGAGGGILGGLLLGWRTVCAVEINSYCRNVLLARQRDLILEPFPVWDDVRTFDGVPWRGHVDVVSAGFPCQDISSAGVCKPRSGLDGARSGLWREAARIISEVRPSVVFIENSPHLRTRGLTTVVRNIAGMGYRHRRGVLGARHVGAPHRRDRIWLVANADDVRQRGQPFDAEVAGTPEDVCHVGGAHLRQQQGRGCWQSREDSGIAQAGDWWDKLELAGMDDGVAHRVDRIAATGNGQVPAVVRLAWDALRT